MGEDTNEYAIDMTIHVCGDYHDNKSLKMQWFATEEQLAQLLKVVITKENLKRINL